MSHNAASSKGFFGAFGDALKENALGVKDSRPKDGWGDTKKEMTIIDTKMIMASGERLVAPFSTRDLTPLYRRAGIAQGGFSAQAYQDAFASTESK